MAQIDRLMRSFVNLSDLFPYILYTEGLKSSLLSLLLATDPTITCVIIIKISPLIEYQSFYKDRLTRKPWAGFTN